MVLGGAVGVSACGPQGGSERTCAPDAVVEGFWAATGAPFGEPMEAALTFDPSQCLFLTGAWTVGGVSMGQGSLLAGGFVDGDRVELFGADPFWESCVGAVGAAGTLLSGECAEADPGQRSWELSLLP